MQSQRGVEAELHLVLTVAVGGQCFAHWKEPCAHCTGDVVCSTSGLDECGEGKVFCHFRVSSPYRVDKLCTYFSLY